MLHVDRAGFVCVLLFKTNRQTNRRRHAVRWADLGSQVLRRVESRLLQLLPLTKLQAFQSHTRPAQQNPAIHMHNNRKEMTMANARLSKIKDHLAETGGNAAVKVG